MHYFGTSLDNHGHYHWELTGDSMAQNYGRWDQFGFDLEKNFVRPKGSSYIIHKGETSFRHENGYSIYAIDFPAHGMGDTVELAKADLQSAVNELLAYYKEEGKESDPLLNGGDLEFVYQYDVKSIFEHIGVLDATSFAKKIGMNDSLLRQYKTGIALASDKQKKKIEAGLHQLGTELLRIRL